MRLARLEPVALRVQTPATLDIAQQGTTPRGEPMYVPNRLCEADLLVEADVVCRPPVGVRDVETVVAPLSERFGGVIAMGCLRREVGVRRVSELPRLGNAVPLWHWILHV